MRGVYLFGTLLFCALCIFTRGTEQSLFLIAEFLMMALARLDETIRESR